MGKSLPSVYLKKFVSGIHRSCKRFDFLRMKMVFDPRSIVRCEERVPIALERTVVEGSNLYNITKIVHLHLVWNRPKACWLLQL